MTATPEIEAWLAGIRTPLDDSLEERRRRDRDHAPRFNVFRAAGIQHRELSHSSFLADLLDPHGAHGQGRLFLDTFLQRCIRKSDGRIGRGLLGDGWSVATEEAWKEGRIDIRLSRSRPRAVVAIENKIYAREGERQLARYAEHLRGEEARNASTLLVYLTLDERSGGTPELQSTEYVHLTYAHDVIPWLESVAVDALPRNVAVVLEQYLEALRALTGRASMSRDDPVVDLLLKPENAGPASVVAEAFRSARRELEEKFWEDVAQALPRHVSDVDAKWTVERPESTSVDDAYDAFLMVLPKAASRHEPPPVYPAVQYFPPSAALFIGLSWREQRPHPATLEAPYSDMRTRVGVDLEQDGWWLAYEMRPYDLKSPDLCGELADERQRNLPARKADEVAEVLARRYVAAMGEHLRDIATSPPGGDRAE